MAMLRKPPKVPCGVCQGAITDGKDEALLCDCGLWFHRGCASVPPSLYKALSNSEDPFICLCCTNILLKHEITELKKELQSMAEVHERCATLATEVSTLRQAIERLSAASPTETNVGSKPNRTYAGAAVRTARDTPRRSNPSTGHGRPRTTAKLSSNTSADASSRPPYRQQRERASASGRVPVVGARRVWGAYALCAPAAIQGAIAKLTSVKVKLQIKRKTKVLSNNMSVW